MKKNKNLSEVKIYYREGLKQKKVLIKEIEENETEFMERLIEIIENLPLNSKNLFLLILKTEEHEIFLKFIEKMIVNDMIDNKILEMINKIQIRKQNISLITNKFISEINSRYLFNLTDKNEFYDNNICEKLDLNKFINIKQFFEKVSNLNIAIKEFDEVFSRIIEEKK